MLAYPWTIDLEVASSEHPPTFHSWGNIANQLPLHRSSPWLENTLPWYILYVSMMTFNRSFLKIKCSCYLEIWCTRQWCIPSIQQITSSILRHSICHEELWSQSRSSFSYYFSVCSKSSILPQLRKLPGFPFVPDNLHVSGETHRCTNELRSSLHLRSKLIWGISCR